MPERGTITAGAVLSTRALNRALLARQMLLARVRRPALEVIEFLVGLQAQEPKDPYVGLWSRLEGFQPEELESLLLERQVARAPLMRGTIHLATERDCLELRPLMKPVYDRALTSNFAKRLPGVDFAELAEAGRALLSGEPRTFADVRRELDGRWPDAETQALGYSVSYLVPLIQPPPRGLWHQSGTTRWVTTERWFGKPMASRPSLDAMVLRYLATFGPASVMDVQAWCGLTRLREVVERLRPQLMTFRDERGVELFDLPDAPRPDPETPAPVRFLPQYDNVFLSHADRTRIVSNEARGLAARENGFVSTLLLDGFIAGTWRLKREGKAATLRVVPYARWAKRDQNAVLAEATRLLAFIAADSATRDVVLEPPIT